MSPAAFSNAVDEVENDAAQIVKEGRALLEDIGLDDAYATGLISDDIITQIFERCRPREYDALIVRLAEEHVERKTSRADDNAYELQREAQMEVENV